jgi:hypothetical protein
MTKSDISQESDDEDQSRQIGVYLLAAKIIPPLQTLKGINSHNRI